MAFDSFMTVPLEIPDVNLRILKVLYFPDVDQKAKDSGSIRPRRLKVKVRKMVVGQWWYRMRAEWAD